MWNLCHDNILVVKGRLARKNFLFFSESLNVWTSKIFFYKFIGSSISAGKSSKIAAVLAY